MSNFWLIAMAPWVVGLAMRRWRARRQALRRPRPPRLWREQRCHDPRCRARGQHRCHNLNCTHD